MIFFLFRRPFALSAWESSSVRCWFSVPGSPLMFMKNLGSSLHNFNTLLLKKHTCNPEDINQPVIV